MKLFAAFSTEDEETKKAKEMEIFTRRYVEMKRPDTSGNDQSYGVIPKFYYKVRWKRRKWSIIASSKEAYL